MSNTIKLTKDELMDLWELEEGEEGDNEGEVIMIEKGKWVSDGKFQYQQIIFSKDNKFWSLHHSRSGSPFTDWYYEIREGDHNGIATEVEQVEVTIKKWRTK